MQEARAVNQWHIESHQIQEREIVHQQCRSKYKEQAQAHQGEYGDQSVSMMGQSGEHASSGCRIG